MNQVEPFEQVVREHGATVWRVCRALLSDTDAGDAWSETFLSALRAYPNLPADSNVKGWLVTIAHNKSIDQIRSAGRRPLPHAEPLVDVSQRPSTEGIPSAGHPELWTALSELSEKQRGAVIYHYVAGLPYAQIGPLLDCSVVAARRSAADGIARLRQIVKEEPER